MLLQGDTITRVQLWDAIRSLDVLAAHPLVDARRLASAGQSGGGTLTMLLAAADDRLAAAAVASGNTENIACADFNPPGATDDAEQDFVGSAPLGFDRWDLLYPFAPKPLWISVSDQDFLTTYSPEYIRNGWEEYQKLESVYRVLGAANRIQWTGTPMPHGLAYDSRVRIYGFLNRWLKPDAAAVDREPPTQPETEETLWATSSGSVTVSLHSRTPFELNRDRPAVVRPVPLATLTGASHPAAGLTPRVLGRAAWGDVRIEAMEIASAPQVVLPAWLYLPPRPNPSEPVLLALEASGRDAHWQEGGVYHVLASRGRPVCVADLRGIGDLVPEVGRGAAAYAIEHASEENYAWASLILGAPLLGQRVTDILALAAALRTHPPTRGLPLKIAASGRLTVAALFAAALDPAIAELYLAAALLSYRSVVETQNYTAPLSNFVFGILSSTDLPEVAASLAPRRVTLAGAADAAGGVLPVERVRAVYPGKHISIEAAARWDADRLDSRA